jgi:hypothetical protein
LVRAILIVVVLAYLLAILWAGVATLRSTSVPSIPDGVLLVITVFGGALATIFGATVGISKRDTNSIVPRLVSTPAMTIRLPNWDAYVWATYAYAAGLGLALLLLIAIFFVNPSGAPDVLKTMGSTMIGVGGAVLAIFAAPPRKP